MSNASFHVFAINTASADSGFVTAPVQDSADWFGFDMTSNNTDAAFVEFAVSLGAGTWRATFFGATANNKGKLKADIVSPALTFGTVDTYSAGSVAAVRTAFPSTIVVTEEALVTLRLTINGKNGSSSAFSIKWNSILLERVS